MTALQPVHENSRDDNQFLTYIRHAIRDPGARAALRRGVGRTPEEAPQMHIVVAPWLPDRPRPALERAYYTVAALLANQPRGQTDTPTDDEMFDAAANLGASFAEAVRTGVMREETSTARLHLLCRQSVDGVHRQLPRAIAQLQAAGIRISWEQLLKDLIGWDRYRDKIAKRWLQSYYRNFRATRNFDEVSTAHSFE